MQKRSYVLSFFFLIFFLTNFHHHKPISQINTNSVRLVETKDPHYPAYYLALLLSCYLLLKTLDGKTI